MRAYLRTAVVVVFTLLPTLAGLWRAWAVGPPRRPERPSARALVDAIPRDATALVNVTAADMPASPDILFLGKRSTRALERCLADNADNRLRALCADMLGTLGDPSALAALRASLGDWETDVRAAVIAALGRVPDAASIDPLLTLFQRRDEEMSNRRAAVRAMGAIGDKKAIAFLRRELAQPRRDLAQPGNDFRPAALRALWRCRHRLPASAMADEVVRAMTPHPYDKKEPDLLRLNDAELAREAIALATELRSDRLVRPLLALAEAPDERTRNRAIQALGLAGDRRALAPLVDLLPKTRDARLLNNIAFALQRLDQPTFAREIRRMASHKQAVLRMNAAFVLGDVRQAEGLPLLERMLADPSERVQLEAALAIAKIAPHAEAVRLLEKAAASGNQAVRVVAIDAVAVHGSERSIPALEQLLAGPAPLVADGAGLVQERIIGAIHRLGKGKRADLVHDRLFLSTDAGIRQRGAILLGKANDPRVRDYLLLCFETRACQPRDVEAFLRADTDPRVRGRVLWIWMRGRDELAGLVGTLRPAGASALVSSGLDVALTRRDWAAAQALAGLLADLQDAASRAPLQAAAAAAGDAWVRVHVLVALARLGDDAASGALMRELDTLPIEWLPRLVAVLRHVREPAARARLEGELGRRQAGKEAATAMAAAAARLEWAPDAALPRLLAGLAAGDVIERETAERYLRRDRTARVDVLLEAARAKEKNPDLKARLGKLLDARRDG
jgi:HEAT repeat protein